MLFLPDSLAVIRGDGAGLSRSSSERSRISETVGPDEDAALRDAYDGLESVVRDRGRDSWGAERTVRPRVIGARALGGCLDGEAGRGESVVPVRLLLAELLTELVLESAELERTLVALRADGRLGVALLLTLAFGRKTGDGADV